MIITYHQLDIIQLYVDRYIQLNDYFIEKMHNEQTLKISSQHPFINKMTLRQCEIRIKNKFKKMKRKNKNKDKIEDDKCDNKDEKNGKLERKKEKIDEKSYDDIKENIHNQVCKEVQLDDVIKKEENEESLKLLPKIIKITLHNFKSYKNTHTVYIDNFNGIVGPNGSGKSNLLDAILFIFGFGARQMRQKTLKDICHKNCNSCYVEVEFMIHPTNERLLLKRELNLGKSNYFLNNRPISATDLKNNLLNLNVPIDNNRFLILQGEIEAIAQLKPKDDVNGGILEYLEDVIGSNQFKDRIVECEKAIEEMRESYETQSSNLKFQEKEYTHFKQKNDEMHKILNQKFENIQIRQNLEKYQVELDKRRNIELNKENKKLYKELKELTKNSQIKRLKQLESELLKEKNKSHRFEREFLAQKTVCHRVKREIEKETHEYETNIKERKNVMKSIENVTREQKLSENEIINAQQELNENQKEIDEFQKKIAIKEKEFQKMKSNSQNQKQILEIENKIATLESKMIKLNTEKNQFKVVQNPVKQQSKEKIFDICKKISVVTGIENENIITEIKTLQSDILSVEHELSGKIERLQNALHHQKNKSQSTDLIKQIKNVKGFIGRLGNMGRVNLKYDIAITAAAKGKLENIIVENVKAAEECIDIIKKKGLKRTSFLILDQIKNNKIRKHPDFIYCIDLIECDEKYQKCFEFALRDTILCDNFSDAKKVAFNKKNRNRTVTYTGELIEKSGLISKNRIIGTMNTAINTEKLSNEIERISKAKEKMYALLREKEDEISECQDLIQYKSKKEFIKSHKNQLEGQIKRFCAISNQLSRSDELYKLICANFSNVTTILKEKESNETVLIDSNITECKNEISQLQKKVNSLTENEIKSMECDLQFLYDQMNIVAHRNQDIEEKINQFQIQVKKEKITELQNMLNDLDQSIAIFEKEKEIKQQKYEEIHKHTLKLETSFEEQQDTIKKILQDVGELKTITDEHMQKELNIKNKVEKNKEIMSEKRQKEDFSDEIREMERLGFHFDNNKEIQSNEKQKENIHANTNSDNKQPDASLNISDSLLEQNILKCKQQIKSTNPEKDVNYSILHEFKKKTLEYTALKNEFEQIKNKFEEKVKLMNNLKTERYDMFVSGYKKINVYLKYFYQRITFGGNAELEFVDISDPFEGINLSIMPPKKTWNKIGSLSGGEKTLASLSLVFALHKYNPSPFYVMDEIDAALDFKNVSLIAQLLKEISAQFIIISLRHNMFEMTEKLIGVFKTDDCSHILSFNREDF